MNSSPHTGNFDVASLYLGPGKFRHTGHCWPLNSKCIVGRQHADIELNISALSRQHAEVYPGADAEAAGYWIRDLNSRNGTAIDGELIGQEPVALHHGTSILLAGAVELFFHDPNATPFFPRLGAIRGLWLDPTTDDVWIDAQQLSPPLSRNQALLLSTIAKADGQTVSREKIARVLWPNAAPGHINNDAIDSLIKRLRRRLATLENGRPVLEIIRGRGLRLVAGR